MTLQDYINQVQLLVHDQQALDFSTVELTQNINNARTAVALDFHCVRGLYITPIASLASGGGSPVSLIQNVEQYTLNGPNSLNGQVVGASVTAGGSNYTSPVVTIGPPAGGGIQATATAVATGGVITQINVTTWGQGYTPGTPPTVSISDGAGTGAAATAVMFNNVFNVVSISNIWGNQRYMLKYRGFSLFQAYMRSQTFFTQRPLIWTIHQETGNILIAPPPDQAYVSEWDVLRLPSALPSSNLGATDTEVLQPWADAVQYYAAMLCLLKLQNFQQADFMRNLYTARVPKIIIGAGGVRIPNPYHKTFQRRVMR